MISSGTSSRADGLLQALGAAYLARRIYAKGHQRLQASADQLLETVQGLVAEGGPLRLGLVGPLLECDGLPVVGTDLARRVATRLEELGCAGLKFTSTVTADSVASLLDVLGEGEGIPSEGMSLDGIDLFASGPEASERDADDGITFPLDEFEVPLRVYRNAHEVLGRSMTQVTAGGDLPLKEIDALTRWAAEEVIARGTTMLAPLALMQEDAYTWQHAVNVFLLATTLLRRFARDAKELAAFGQAALLHDIGKARIPRDILRKEGPLDENELAIMRLHPELGAEILGGQPGIDPLSIEVAYCHHMRDDGHGYPRASNLIRPGPACDIVQVADMFEALTSPRPYKGGVQVLEALRIIVDTPGMTSKRPAVAVLLRHLTAAPPGSEVQLASGDLAVVVQVHEDAPGRPLVRIVTDADGVPVRNGRLLDLRNERDENPIRRVLLRPSYLQE